MFHDGFGLFLCIDIGKCPDKLLRTSVGKPDDISGCMKPFIIAGFAKKTILRIVFFITASVFRNGGKMRKHTLHLFRMNQCPERINLIRQFFFRITQHPSEFIRKNHIRLVSAFVIKTLPDSQMGACIHGFQFRFRRFDTFF